SRLTTALDIISVEKQYLPLCQILLQNVFLLEAGEVDELEKQLPHEETVILHKSGKFSKNRLSLSGGSVGLFEGKRIGRAKNLENLTKEIKSLGLQIHTQQQNLEAATEKLAGLKGTSKQQYMVELGHQL